MKRNERTRQHADSATVSLWLDAYTDIFSDFDPRPFAERAISDDFIVQVRRLARDAGGVAALRLLLPEGAEREESERTIRKRLHDYFDGMYEQLDAEARAVRNKGLQMTAAGVAMMIVASYIYYRGLTLFSHYLLLVLLEPGGWFLFWNGLDDLFNFAKAKQRDVAFFARMAAVHVEFGTYKP
ncbi:MAG: hypothetical protein ACO1PZ_16310 [Gammaproteobacteria bacterium]